jgi:hypothetical protein
MSLPSPEVLIQFDLNAKPLKPNQNRAAVQDPDFASPRRTAAPRS